MAILDFLVSGWHGFGSLTQVCFGVSVSNFMCMSFVAVGRSLTIVSYVAFKMAALWFWTMFNCNPLIAHCHPLLWGGGILVDHWSTISSFYLLIEVAWPFFRNKYSHLHTIPSYCLFTYNVLLYHYFSFQNLITKPLETLRDLLTPDDSWVPNHLREEKRSLDQELEDVSFIKPMQDKPTSETQHTLLVHDEPEVVTKKFWRFYRDIY